MKILLTSTSFQDSPGKHHDKLRQKGLQVDKLRGPLSADKLIPIIANYDGVICGDDDYTEDVLIKGKKGRLKVISKYGIGLDKIDVNTANQLDIKVLNTPGVNHQAVAEHAFALLLSYEKNIIKEHQIIRNNSWNRLTGHELYKKSIGILGLGNVGKEIAKRGKAFGMKIYAFDISPEENFISEYDINYYDSIHSFIHKIDYMFLSLPLNNSTKDLIGEYELSLLKKDIIIINTARAGLISENSLINSIKNNNIRAYLTDVLIDEPIIKNHPFLKFDNVLITPHIGSRNYETVERQGLKAVLNLFKFFNI